MTTLLLYQQIITLFQCFCFQCFFNDIVSHLVILVNFYTSLDDHKNWQLFLTSETSKELPNNLLCLCEKISFDNLASLKEEKAIEYPLIVQNIVKSVKVSSC